MPQHPLQFTIKVDPASFMLQQGQAPKSEEVQDKVQSEPGLQSEPVPQVFREMAVLFGEAQARYKFTKSQWSKLLEALEI